ncbi:MAG: hypothetical protein CVU99_09555 [Firmicutes bacterium HGW-Firmicutes-4]|jgi:ligand-binding sensor protein|uniref:Histidine kinase n=1 Tax=Acetobacterium wieringae TaxID=52694 RepID=A0A5D0WWD9_9FIRM|nr:PocR ligand-binding domain-containing protein [Acetobacterium wieringae]PKM60178.1 MAG: hypothetical protein CVU99_09555 [Firmicutes bacterium HGW-Firmicutes-4]TYC87951.1 hypothetical protein FXB42_03520 [Acetobacterium wieringae]
MTAHLLHLTDLVPKELLEDIANKFYKATKLSTLITDYQGRPIISLAYFIPLCKKIRAIPELCQNCMRSDAYAGLESSINKTPLIYKCHSGLIDVSIPIFINNNYLGLILTGQILLVDEDMNKIENISKETLDYSLYPELLQEFNEFSKNYRKLSLDELQAYVNLLSLTANYVAELGYKILMQERLKEQEIQVLEAQKTSAEARANSAQLALKMSEETHLKPEFLFDSFNSIYQQAILEDAKTTAELIYSFTSLIKKNLKHEPSLITLEKELEYVENYILIKNLSKLYKFEIDSHIEPECLHFKLPEMILQSLIENVMMPSIEDIENDCSLTVSIAKQNKMLHIELINEPYLLPTLTLTEINNIETCAELDLNLSQLTIKNITDLLKRYYHDNFVFFIDTAGKIILKLPIDIVTA